MKCSRNFGAVAQVRGDARNPLLRGTVRFLPHRDGVLVVAQISGLPETQADFFGFHIHEGEDCGGAEFADTKGHYNPQHREHPMHAGDLPPLMRTSDGKAFLSVVTDRFNTDEILGRTVVIHGHPDDFTSQPAGNSGMKIACGRIGRM